MLNFQNNLNPFGPPEGTSERLAQTSELLLQYGERGQETILAAYAQTLGVAQDCVAHGAGATALLHAMPRFFSPAEPLTLRPTFWEYTAFNEAAGHKMDYLPLDESSDFLLNINATHERLADQSNVLYICNPNNPTSTLITPEAIVELSSEHPQTEIVVDETYLFFHQDFHELTASRLATTVPNVHVVLSLSKFFAVPGIRSGAMISDENTIHRFAITQAPYTANRVTSEVGAWLLGQNEFIKRSRQNNWHARLGMMAAINTMLGDTVTFIPPQANFIFLRETAADSGLAAYLHAQAIAVRKGSEFGDEFGPWIRCSIRTEEDNITLLRAIRDRRHNCGQ